MLYDLRDVLFCSVLLLRGTSIIVDSNKAAYALISNFPQSRSCGDTHRVILQANPNPSELDREAKPWGGEEPLTVVMGITVYPCL